MALSVYLTALLLFRATLSQSQPPAFITSFVQSPDGVLAPNARVSFTCQSTVPALSWVVGGVGVITSSDEFTIVTTNNNDLTISSLSMLAKIDLNNTEVSCVAMSSRLSSSDSQSTHIIVAAPPLPPFLQVSLYTNGSSLEAEWNSPFTMLGFPVTFYTLSVVNKTTGNTMKFTVYPNISDLLTYDLLSSNMPSSCHNISFSLIATNSVGDSSVSNIVNSGFPIFPQTDHVVLHVDLNYTSTLLSRLILTFEAPIVCPFQTPATYTIGIFDENGDEVGLTAPKPAIAATASNSVIDVFETRLMTGNSYSAELTIQHPNVPGEAFITFIGIDFLNTTVATGHNNAGNSPGPPSGLLIISTTVMFIFSAFV